MMIARAITLLLAAGIVQAAELPPASRELRAGLRTVERSIERRFGETSMVMIGRTRGGYLEGFGAVFTLEVNVVAMANLSPFKPSYTEGELHQLNQRKRDRLEELQKLGVDILVKEAGKLGEIPDHEQVALVISLFHFTWEDATGLPSQLVIQAPRRALLDRQAGRSTATALAAQVKMRYF